MAKIEDLVTRISDPHLRREIDAEIAHLKQTQDFGLVYEEHIPEVSPLHGLPVSVGDLVQKQDDPSKRLLRVRSIDGEEVEVASAEEDESHVTQLSKLQVVKWVGEAVYPALKPLGQIEGSTEARPFHAVINGENYQALELLEYMYQGQVDCIYIDPPYNTGASDWKYNNRFVDENDSWRHSKWLSFMAKRLRLAKNLLKPDGVLIVTIDEHEVHHLGMLLEQLFRKHERHMVTIVHNPKGTYKSNFARTNEHAFFCIPPRENDIINPLPRGMFARVDRPEQLERATPDEDEEDEPPYEDLYLRRRGQESSFRTQRPNQFYALLVNEETEEVVGIGPHLEKDDNYEVTQNESIVTVYPLDTKNKERVWRYKRETMQEYLDAGEIVITGRSTRTGQGWVIQHRVPQNPNKRLKTVWWEKRHDAGMHGSDLLSDFLGVAAQFPFPKSVYAVRDCLDAVVRNRPSALIVDFFAGSGTTFHAACLLNARDGGKRRSVLVTNNDVDKETAQKLMSQGLYPGEEEFERHGIFESVTRPRIEGVVTGRQPDGDPIPGDHVWADRRPYADGFDENVEFFKLEFLDPDDVDLGRQFDAVLPALWLAAGGVGQRESGVSNQDYSIPADSTYAVLFREERFPQFREAIRSRPDVSHVYLVTDSEDAYAEMRADLPGHVTSSMLYSDYLRNFRINTISRR